jgi:lauroyl/myristoyl acyltransferase
LKQLADAHALPKLARVFEEAIMRELGQGHMQGAGEFYSITLTKPEEIGPVRALVESLRNPRYKEIGAKAVRLLAPVIEDIQKPIEEARQAMRQGEAMLAAHRAGKTDVQIAKFFGVPIQQVREWKRATGLTQKSRTP